MRAYGTLQGSVLQDGKEKQILLTRQGGGNLVTVRDGQSSDKPPFEYRQKSEKETRNQGNAKEV